MPVQELDRVLDREDVLVPSVVDVVEQRGQRRRLPGAGGPCDEDEAAGLVGELVQPCRDAELLERLDLRGDEPEGCADARALEVAVDAEARETGDRVGEVDLTARLEELLLLGGEDPVHERPDLLRRQVLVAGHPLQAPVDADDGGRSRRQVEVGRVPLDRHGEQVVD